MGSGILVPPMRQDELHIPNHQGLDMFDPHQDNQSVIHWQLKPHPHTASGLPTQTQIWIPTHSMMNWFILASFPQLFLWCHPVKPGPDDSFELFNLNHLSDLLCADEFGVGDEAAVNPFVRVLEASDGTKSVSTTALILRVNIRQGVGARMHLQ